MLEHMGGDAALFISSTKRTGPDTSANGPGSYIVGSLASDRFNVE
jgi:hypothetical protein